jgi:hypothetical protein
MKLRQAELKRPLSQKASMGEGENQVFPELGAISVRAWGRNGMLLSSWRGLGNAVLLRDADFVCS